MSQQKYIRTLTIAGSDSGGGAGIQADLKTFSALGCYGMSAITALTAQNTQTVEAVFAVKPVFVRRQIQAVVDDIGVDAIKIGMLNSAEIVKAVADELKKMSAVPVIADPVMVAKSGDPLLQKSAIEALKNRLVPLAELITPNIPEAEVLAEMDIADNDDMKKAGAILLDTGSDAVLIKGGHAVRQKDESSDLLIYNSEGQTDFRWITAKRIETMNTHGTGCTYSSAIAAFRARGFDLPEAVQHAKNYISQAIAAGADYTLGYGHGPVHHFHNLWS